MRTEKDIRVQIMHVSILLKCWLKKQDKSLNNTNTIMSNQTSSFQCITVECENSLHA
jgi:hypothetical protein